MHKPHPGKPRLLYAPILIILFFASSAGRYQTTVNEPDIDVQALAVWPLLAGMDDGLYGFDQAGTSVHLWSGGPVRKIIRAGDGWLILGSEGILASPDLTSWETRNRGLPVKIIKIYQEGKISFLPVIQEIKDLEVNPANPGVLVCATKDQVYLSYNEGRDWKSLGAPPFRTNGIKAVASAYMPARAGFELTVFVSHSTYGLFYIHPDRPDFPWTELNEGLEKLETTDNPDEVSDIAAVMTGTGGAAVSAEAAPDVYVSQTFRRRIYRLDWTNKRFDLLWSDKMPFGTVDSLDPGSSGLRFIREGAVEELAYPMAGNQRLRQRPDILESIRSIPANPGRGLHCVFIPEDPARPNSPAVSLSELWLLNEVPPEETIRVRGREGLYLPVNHAMDSQSLKPYLDIIRERSLDMVVIDMKDDYGRLRFSPKNPAITAKGRVFRPLDIEAFLREMKSRGIYTAARIVVFKDPVLAGRDGGKYAVWNFRDNKAWAGYYDTRRKKTTALYTDRREDLSEILPADDPEYEILRTYYDEQWVDPYSEEVWEYTAAVAEELYERGFDEIQFDYIRFPTDGVNLGDAQYRWQDPGMDMESAIVSFLRHIRSRINAPISIDIYGANGWYRTGARTGQEVELLAPWVDIICPMYYPSHFEQDFLAQEPAELRPYRIYFQGTQRTRRIGRGRIIVRPYAQAFYLNVSYDRRYYNTDYVRRQAEGVRDAGGPGLTYWNNSGRYDDIPFPGDFAKSTFTTTGDVSKP